MSNYEVKPVYIYINGNSITEARRVIINRKKLPNWYKILDEISKSINNIIIVKKLFQLDGTLVTHFEELKQNEYYIASDGKSFKNQNYGFFLKFCKIGHI